LPPLNAILRLRETARRFLAAVTAAEPAAARRVAAVPFLINGQAMPSAEDLEELLVAAAQFQPGLVSFSVLQGIAPLDEYLRTAMPEERAFLAALKAEVRVLTVVAWPGNDKGKGEEFALFLVPVGGQPRVLGVSRSRIRGDR
jgi:hypothetical protein